MRRDRNLYTLLSIGAIGTFFGHGMWAVDAKDTFVELFSGTFDHVFGIEMSTDTATTWVQAIGWVDIGVAVVLTLMLIGNLMGTGALAEFAYGPVALVLYGWGVLWGFLTAGSRVTAVGDFYPEVWDVVERAPNFMLPAALIYLVYRHRLDHTVGSVTAADVVNKTAH